MTRLLPVLAALVVCAGSTAQAHVVAQPAEGSADSYFATAFRVSHGCNGSATTAVKIAIPEGIDSIKPQAKPGWTITQSKQTLDTPRAGAHGSIREIVTEIVWRGGPLPDDQFDTFPVVMRLPAKDGPLYFKTTQECESGSMAWAEIPAAGQAWNDMKQPAPVVRVQMRQQSAAVPAASSNEYKAGDLVIRNPWSRATPGGAKIGGGYLTITNNGTAPDRLVSVKADNSEKVEIHEMATKDGVMTMRQISGGLSIAPGQTVTLAPGGYHLMLMGLKAPLKEGDRVKATLAFERAGNVDVVINVEGMGAQRSAPASGGHQHH